MKNNGLTLSIIFEAQSANYGEGMGNIATLKKITRGDGNVYSYISRQAIRYNIIQQLGWDSADSLIKDEKDNKSVVQFAPNATIDKFPEIDFFGYLKTVKSEGSVKRNAVVRLSNAVALESFSSETDFLTNMGFATRIKKDNNIAQSEIHKSFYAYTITIDLDQIGIDANGSIEISNEKKRLRVNNFLETVASLYRDIRGRRENLSPVFVIGGNYARKNPFFENRLLVSKGKLDVQKMLCVMDSCGIKDETMVGYIDNTFANDEEIKKELNPSNPGEFFEKLKQKVADYYG